MPADRKRLSSSSPKKVQTEMTLFTGKRSDNKSSPARSYAQAASNRFEALSDDEEMEDVINQLRKDGIRLYCKQKPVWHKNGEIDWTKQKFDSCEVIMVSW